MLNCIAKMKSVTQCNDAKQIVYRRIDFSTDRGATATHPSIVKEVVIDLMMEIALDNMTSFYSLILKDFGLQCNIVDCYSALYLYKCLQYDDTLQLCERILNEPDRQSYIKEFSFANVFLIPPLDSFFDGHVQSLLGFHTLFYYLVPPLNGDLQTYEVTDDSTFEQWFSHAVKFKRVLLCVVLLGPYSIKYHYFWEDIFLQDT